jgi:hypothetical protein
MGTGSPAPRRLNYLHKRLLNLGIELESHIGAALHVPLERCIILGPSFLVK